MSDLISFPPRDDADAKAWFYLDHRHDIETWAAQREDGRRIVEQYLLALALPVQALADELGAEPDVGDFDSDSFPRMGLRRASWRHGGVNDVSVVIQWEKDNLLKPGVNLLKPGANEWPYVAVRLSGSKENKERWRQLAAAMTPVRSRLKGRKGFPWPFWRYEMPRVGAESLDPEALAQGLLKSFRELWDEAAPVLDELHSGQAAERRVAPADELGHTDAEAR